MWPSTSRAVVKRSRGIADAAEPRRRLPPEEEQGRRDLGRGQADRQGQGRRRRPPTKRRRARSAPATTRPSTSSSRPARGRARCPGLEPDKKLVWTYFEAMVPPSDAEVAARHRLGRDRHRVRLLLPDARRRGDGGRDPAADPAGRGRTRSPRMRASVSRSRGSRSTPRRRSTKLEKGKNDVTATIETEGRQDARRSTSTA